MHPRDRSLMGFSRPSSITRAQPRRVISCAALSTQLSGLSVRMMRLEARIARAVIFSMTELPISLPLTTFQGTITAFVRHDSAVVDDMAA